MLTKHPHSIGAGKGFTFSWAHKGRCNKKNLKIVHKIHHIQNLHLWIQSCNSINFISGLNLVWSFNKIFKTLGNQFSIIRFLLVCLRLSISFSLAKLPIIGCLFIQTIDKLQSFEAFKPNLKLCTCFWLHKMEYIVISNRRKQINKQNVTE